MNNELKKDVYVTASYNEYSNEFDFSVQTWEPGEHSDAFVLAVLPIEYVVTATREELVAKQLGNLDTKEETLRTEFNSDLMEVKDMRNKLMALTYDEPMYEEEKDNSALPV